MTKYQSKVKAEKYEVEELLQTHMYLLPVVKNNKSGEFELNMNLIESVLRFIQIKILNFPRNKMTVPLALTKLSE